MTQGDDLETYQFPGESNDRIEASQPARSPPVASGSTVALAALLQVINCAMR
jgi:hypothetical protein